MILIRRLHFIEVALIHFQDFFPEADMGIQIRLREISLPVFLLVMTFNISGWIDINAIIAELPFFVNRLPEGWNIASYVFLTLNGGKVAMFVYIIIKKMLGERLQEMPVIYVIIGVGAVSLLLLAFFWDRTVWIGGAERSLVLLSLLVCLGSVDAMSNVVYVPYMARFKSQYIVAYFLGEACSSVIPGVLGLVQGIDEKPICRNTSTETEINSTDSNGTTFTEWMIVADYPSPQFSIQLFLVVIWILMIVSGIAFTLLHFHPYCKRGYNRTTKPDRLNLSKDLGISSTQPSPEHAGMLVDTNNPGIISLEAEQQLVIVAETKNLERPVLSLCQFLFLLLLAFMGVFLIYGVSPGLYPYAALP